MTTRATWMTLFFRPRYLGRLLGEYHVVVARDGLAHTPCRIVMPVERLKEQGTVSDAEPEKLPVCSVCADRMDAFCKLHKVTPKPTFRRPAKVRAAKAIHADAEWKFFGQGSGLLRD